MNNFDVELAALIFEWLNRGADPEGMAKHLREKADELWELSDPRHLR